MIGALGAFVIERDSHKGKELKIAFASMLVLSLMAAPALAAGNSQDQGDADAGTPPAIAAPVPDPFIAEIYKTCTLATSGAPDVVAKLKAEGWSPTVEGDTQTPFYQAFDGARDFDSVGTVNITFSTEVWPTTTEAYCTASIDNAGRLIGISDFGKMPGLKGTLTNSPTEITGTWEEDAANPSFFVQADQHKDDLYFVMDMTRLLRQPAAKIPHVNPPAPDTEENDTPADSGATTDSGPSI